MLLFRLRESCTLIAVLTHAGLMISRSHCFLVGGPAGPARRSTPGGRRIATGTEEDRLRTRRFVFERMSEDAIQALGSAQKLAIQYKLTSVNGPSVLAGCVEHPDSSALQRTLRQYKVTGRRLQTTMASQYSTTGSNKESMGWLAGFKAAEKDEDLPFDATVQRTLRASGKLADQMQSTNIYSHHIILALLEYSGKKKPGDVATAAAEGDNNEAWQTLIALNVLDDGVTALQFCESLVSNLQQDDTSNKGASASGRELVTGSGGGGSSKTPTLAEVGVDLTQQAVEGLLDPVFGRDNEIRACVRTLIRRRKNCVVLIGDAVRCCCRCCCCCGGGSCTDNSCSSSSVYIHIQGVGKTAIAEGVAQILADPTKCPRPLSGHRLVTVELAALVAGTRYRGDFEE
jgi:ATP-dependent Clp protease ATP-binding subunit ClpC